MSKNNDQMSDWIKTVIAIVIQSFAIGYYMSSIKSNIDNMSVNFSEFKSATNTKVQSLEDKVMLLRDTVRDLERTGQHR